MITEATTLYKKVGKKYIPHTVKWYEDATEDRQAVGTFRLTYAYAAGGKRYSYNVTPATATTVAAMMVAKVAMEEKIRDMARMNTYGYSQKPYTKKQLALIAKFRDDMGGMYPSWWVERSANEISDAAIKAVLEFKP